MNKYNLLDNLFDDADHGICSNNGQNRVDVGLTNERHVAMNKKKYVKISVDELAELIEAKKELSALNCGGVDNWEWYGECFESYIEDTEFENWDDYIESCTSEENILKEYEQVD